MLRALLFHPNLPKFRSLFLLSLTMVLLGYGIWATISALQPHATRLRLGAGHLVTRRFQVANYLAEEAAEQGFTVNVVASKNANEALSNWQNGQVELAVLSSGVTLPHTDDVRVVAGLDFEPLHIIVRREFAESKLPWLHRLRSSRINLGEVGTNDYQLGCALLRYLRLLEGQDLEHAQCQLSYLPKDALIAKARTAIEPLPPGPADSLVDSDEFAARARNLAELPDVIFVVESVPSVTAQALFDTGEYVLMPFPYAQSFIASELRHEKLKAGFIDRACVEKATIPASAYLGHEPIPADDCLTIGMRSLLVAKANLSKPTVKRLMHSVFSGDFAQRIEPVSPRELVSQYEIHPGAIAFLDRNNPLITQSAFDIAGSALSIFGAFSAGALALWGYVRRNRIRRPEEYLEEIRKVDLLAAGGAQEHLTDAATTERVHQLDRRLMKLKEQLIHDYCGNRVQGEMVLLSILSMLADSRNQLHRSQPARAEHLPPVKLSEPESASSPTLRHDVLRNLRSAA